MDIDEFKKQLDQHVAEINEKDKQVDLELNIEKAKAALAKYQHEARMELSKLQSKQHMETVHLEIMVKQAEKELELDQKIHRIVDESQKRFASQMVDMLQRFYGG